MRVIAGDSGGDGSRKDEIPILLWMKMTLKDLSFAVINS
jgi:hypothetical protein